MILSSEIGSHSFRLFPASLDKISATPFSRGALSSVTPEYSTVPSVASWTFSALLHLVSLTPRIARPNLFISLATWCALSVWYIVRTFHAPVRVRYLGDKIFGFDSVIVDSPWLVLGIIKVTTPFSITAVLLSVID